jgi:hypothetical protein
MGAAATPPPVSGATWFDDIRSLAEATVSLLGALWDPTKPGLNAAVQKWIQIAIGLAVESTTDILEGGLDALGPIAAAFLAAWQTNGGSLAGAIETPIAAAAAAAFNTSSSNLLNQGTSEPTNAIARAAAAFSEAFGFGISSAAVTALFEMLVPEKLNVLNGIGPMLASMAGFEEISANVRDPLYRNAFGRSLEYYFRSQFKPDLPDESDAVLWHARGLLSDTQLETIFGYSGLKAEYEPAFVASAYRAVQPFLLARAAENGSITPAQLNTLLTFAGYRPGDIEILNQVFAAMALLPYQQQYLVAAVRAAELGTITPAELGDDMTEIGLNQDQQAIVQLTVATRKLEQLAELYRKSISEAYAYGTLTDAQYVPALEAIGIASADAQAHYAVDSTKKLGKAALAAQRAALKLANQRNKSAENAAIAGFRNGTLDAAELAAALELAGMDPLVAGYVVAIQSAKLAGNLTFVYGVTLPRDKAVLLRQKVGALGNQVKAQLVTPADALTELAALNIPDANAKALVAGWAATHTSSSDVGVKLPI